VLVDRPLRPFGAPPSPVNFTEAIERSLHSDRLPVWFSEAAPDEWARYRHQYATVSEAVSSIFPAEGITPLTILDEFVVGLYSTCWSAGLVAGAEIEHLRQALIKPKQVCPSCYGYGAVKRYLAEDGDVPTCTRCGGIGTMPTGAV
jgi:hypothetical protein